MSRPSRNPAALFCPGDEGYLAYDPATDRVHRLNAAASLVIELCDGQRTPAEIQSLVAQAVVGASPQLAAQCIEAGMAAGLICSEPQPPTAILPAELAKQLRADGKIEAAYICQYNAAEQDADNPAQWSALGELAHILGRRQAARSAYERFLELEPDDAEVRHLLIALRNEPPPPRASNDVIEQLYERFSPFYEANVVEELDYQAPKRLAAMIADLIGSRRELDALDLGCGSGLAGIELRPRCKRLAGIDLSPQMVDLARERKLYDVLEVAEITDWLSRCREAFDLIVACDTLIYFGDLRQVIAPSAALLVPGGLLLFSVERGEQAPFKLSDNGRYTHHPDHLREVASEAGLEVARLDEGYLRMEYGEEVTGLFAALRRVGD